MSNSSEGRYLILRENECDAATVNCTLQIKVHPDEPRIGVRVVLAKRRGSMPRGQVSEGERDRLSTAGTLLYDLLYLTFLLLSLSSCLLLQRRVPTIFPSFIF